MIKIDLLKLILHKQRKKHTSKAIERILVAFSALSTLQSLQLLVITPLQVAFDLFLVTAGEKIKR